MYPAQIQRLDDEVIRLRAELDKARVELASARETLMKIAQCGNAGWVEDYGDTAVEYARARAWLLLRGDIR